MLNIKEAIQLCLLLFCMLLAYAFQSLWCQLSLGVVGLFVFMYGLSIIIHRFHQKLTPIPPSLESYALITGASSGLGTDYAKKFAELGYSIIVVARRSEALKKLASELVDKYGVKVIVETQDLSAPNAANELYERVCKVMPTGSSVDILINNAGFGKGGDFICTDLSDSTRMANLNMVCLMELCHVVAMDMKKRGRGRIMNIGSVAGIAPGPYEAVYSATKAFVNSLSVALSYELGPDGIGVLNVIPGATVTEFAKISGSETSPVFLIPGLKAQSQTVIDQSVAALNVNGKYVDAVCAPSSFMNTVFSFVNPNIPFWFGGALSKWMWSPMKKKA